MASGIFVEVAWWRAEGNAADAAGVNSGNTSGGVGYAAGKVGRAFSFAGGAERVQVPDRPELNPTNGLTLEAWVLDRALPTAAEIGRAHGLESVERIGAAQFDALDRHHDQG